MTIYDNSLIDDASHEHVVFARAQGRAWAEREHEIARDHGIDTTDSEWHGLDTDAALLVDFAPTDEIDNMFECGEELRAICNSAAAARWNELTSD
jgi:hypothetical protein